MRPGILCLKINLQSGSYLTIQPGFAAEAADPACKHYRVHQMLITVKNKTGATTAAP